MISHFSYTICVYRDMATRLNALSLEFTKLSENSVLFKQKIEWLEGAYGTQQNFINFISFTYLFSESISD